jgi:hypothetical protein
MWLTPPSLEDLLCKRKRLENLYYIIDKSGHEVPLILNWAQKQLDENRWYQMLILKARQLGCTTFWAIDFLDDCFWQTNLSAGIIAHRREDAENIFKKKVKFAYDRMPAWTKEINSATNDRSGELAFRNGSSYRVSTGFRSGTNQRLLVSEFGKICADSPDVAKEIVTGSLNTVGTGQIVVIESTAEGREGYFYDYSKEAEQLAQEKVKLSPMQMRFFFFPWFLEPSYAETDKKVSVSLDTNKYIDKIEDITGHKININQRRWYQLKASKMGDSMKQEYPSTPTEAFEASNEGLYYGSQIAQMRREGKLCKVPYQESQPVHTAFDIGYHDHTSIWFVQLGTAGIIQLIDYFEDHGKGAKYYVDLLKSKGYTYGTHIFPHDAKSKHPNTGTSWYDEFIKLTKDNVQVLDQAQCNPFNGIQSVRSNLSRCYFDEYKCKAGIKALESYKREWNDKLGCYRDAPLHDWSSHCADSFRYLCVALEIGYIGGNSMNKESLNRIKTQAGFGPKPGSPNFGPQFNSDNQPYSGRR